MGHDAADRERLLRSADEQHQFPGGHSAAAVLRQESRRRGELWRIGAVIGHELTHGFDDRGPPVRRRRAICDDWWTAADAKAFDQRAECFDEEYAASTRAGGVHMNGKLTLGENTADNGGLRIAWMALMNDLAGKTLPKNRRLHEAAAVLPRLRPDLVHQRNGGGGAAAGADRIRMRIDRFRVNGDGVEHAGISEGVRLQGRAADGPRCKCLPRVVAGRKLADAVGWS